MATPTKDAIMRSRDEENFSPAGKNIQQEEHQGPSKIVHLSARRGVRRKPEAVDPGTSPDRHIEEAAENAQTDMRDAMPEPPSREEIDAKLTAAEARTEARFAALTGTLDVRFANLDVRFANLDNKIDRLADAVGQLSGETVKTRQEVNEQNRTTRSTMIITAVASVLAIIGIIIAVLLTSQSNLLSAFQAGLAVKTFQSQPPANH